LMVFWWFEVGEIRGLCDIIPRFEKRWNRPDIRRPKKFANWFTSQLMNHFVLVWVFYNLLDTQCGAFVIWTKKMDENSFFEC
jgi:hypothetical protein